MTYFPQYYCADHSLRHACNRLSDLGECLPELSGQGGLNFLFVSHNLSVVRHVAPRDTAMFGVRSVDTHPLDDPIDCACHGFKLSENAVATGRRGIDIREREGAADDLSRTLTLVGYPFRARCSREMPECDDVDWAATALNGVLIVAFHAVARDLMPPLVKVGAYREPEPS